MKTGTSQTARATLHLSDDGENNLAIALGKMGDMPAAVKHFRQAIMINPEFAQAHAGLAQALAILGNRDEAMRHHQEAQRLLNPSRNTPGSAGKNS